ncbi:lipopolysaccharide heptosyltransferase family protein [Lacinutrix sp. C3R15]|uniref:glycosyltransferase family 9 protein n=1 Tax=Flavobacteriaceae TaxID=49546 RepID=UPI001C0931F9|nr:MULTISPECIES: glycosyltransferase family 9 protein [Flavobacteriaceae]MBU2939344.1 lipopolysaccharide heptosyltransferase family protein [Lacinutrix sp. C3R15]MDO6622659.1 glycosyltransferase family 9 protein [Oceanihabitans sp. 1_MG-2023]
MSFHKKVNNFRRSLMQKLSKRVGNAHFKNIDTSNRQVVKRVLICRPNHRLGNLILTTPLLQEVNRLFPEATIDFVVQGGLAPILFQEFKSVDRIIMLPKRAFKYPLRYIKGVFAIKKYKYDIAITAVKKSSSGKLFTLFSNATYKVFGEEEEGHLKLKYPDYNHKAKKQVYSLREYLYKLGYSEIKEPIAPLSIKLSYKELQSGKDILKDLVKNDKPTICIFTYATGVKCYPEKWWLPFYDKLKKSYSNYNIIEILPKENVSQIQFKAPSFYSHDVREIAAVIANTKAFIGADSGIMHLASASGAPTIGLFGVTKISKYAPYFNGVAIDAKTTDIAGCMQVVNNVIQKVN